MVPWNFLTILYWPAPEVFVCLSIVQIREERAQGKSHLYKYLKGGCKDSWSLALLSSAQWQDRKEFVQAERQEIPFDCQEAFFQCGGDSTDTGCPQRLQSLYPWRYSKTIWTWSWTTSSRWPCLSKGHWPEDLQRCLPISNIFILFFEIRV